ncbi:cupin domain-containing protein [Methylocystis bryophila]|uniref:Oxalate decarboxylase n=1 Tax=Methylocystis bryophila TaxID=655015 RepID=A0A1W6N009_9HYPH|nr:cupin domain-containing protein [Methylocystis bryophila]ARN83160.1 oxalate decarboxylase [Methylocystis bryophila]BDV39490.1 oxalate decarboxylase OxdD [Methylocystis bryophila]
MLENRRRVLQTVAAGASGFLTFSSLAEATDKYMAAAGDGGYGRAARPLPPGDTAAFHDPKDAAAAPEFRFPLDSAKPRVATGGWAKEVSSREFPLAKGVAGVHALLNPGGSRELHWHATAAEWAIVLEGRCQTVVIDPSGASEINNFEPGDLWYFAKGHGHSIQTIGDKPCNIILAFDDGGFSPDAAAFSITDWINLTPKEMLGQEFGLPKDLFDAFPKGETFMQAGEILQPEDALEAPWPKESTHKFRLLRDPKAARDFDAGTFRLATSAEFPTSKTMSGGVMTIKPRALHKLHWHPNANEWMYFARGRGQVALFGSGGRGKVAEFGPGDVACIPMGFGHAIRNIGDEELEIVQTWDNGRFEEIQLDQCVQSSPRYLLANNFAGVPQTTLAQMKHG